ncbi:32869_t:CDS:2, partial [Racocetra persica]
QIDQMNEQNKATMNEQIKATMNEINDQIKETTGTWPVLL